MGPRDFGDLGRRNIYFQVAGDTGNYFRELGRKLAVLGI